MAVDWQVLLRGTIPYEIPPSRSTCPWRSRTFALFFCRSDARSQMRARAPLGYRGARGHCSTAGRCPSSARPLMFLQTKTIPVETMLCSLIAAEVFDRFQGLHVD